LARQKAQRQLAFNGDISASAHRDAHVGGGKRAPSGTVYD